MCLQLIVNMITQDYSTITKPDVIETHVNTKTLHLDWNETGSRDVERLLV